MDGGSSAILNYRQVRQKQTNYDCGKRSCSFGHFDFSESQLRSHYCSLTFSDVKCQSGAYPLS